MWVRVAVACAVGGVSWIRRDDLHLQGQAAVRASRAAAAALAVARCYRALDPETPDYAHLRSQTHQQCAEILLDLCKTNKGVYIKVGQHIGALDYLLPSEYVDTMKILHKDAPSNTIDQLYKVIEEDLNEDPSKLFVEFEPSPIGTASLAQVHKAKLRNGDTVAVKVQHHFVKENTKADILAMELLVKIMSMVFTEFNIQWLVDETKTNIFKELNFIEEGKNSEKAAEMFKHYPWLKIPKVYWEYSTERVLVMEYVEGGQVNDLDYVKKNNINPYDLCKKLGDLYSHMIFINGFVHSDPHPGNILIKKSENDKDVTIYLIDHGLYAALTDEFRYHYSQFWLSIIERDQAGMKYHAEHLNIKGNMYVALACIVSGRPWSVILKGIDKIKPNDEERNTIKNQLPNVIDKIAQCLQHIDRQALLILKTNDLIRGIEYALQTNKSMCGLMVLTKCCILSGYEGRIKRANSNLKIALIYITKMCAIFKFYLLFTIIGIRSMF